MEKFVFTVSENEVGIPLKKVIKSKYHFSSRLMTKIKYQELLMLNGKKVPGYYTAELGDTVTVSIPDEISHFEPEDIPIDVIYEDDDLLVINKQPGVTCHPTKGHPNHTMANAIMKYMLDTGQSFKIRFINRLDMDTSGVLLIGKNSFAQAELIKQMDLGLTTKKYYALVSGIVDDARLRELAELEGVSVFPDSEKATDTTNSFESDTSQTGSACMDTPSTGSPITDTPSTGSPIMDSPSTGSAIMDTPSTGSAIMDTPSTGSSITDTPSTGSSILSNKVSNDDALISTNSSSNDDALISTNSSSNDDTVYVLIDLPIGAPLPESVARRVILEDELNELRLQLPDTNPDHIDGIYPSKTKFRVLKTNGNQTLSMEIASLRNTTLIEVELLSGRTHQIRVHMSHIGHPLIGDWLYGGPTESFSRQALHAASFSCIHPITKEHLTFNAPIPEDMLNLITITNK